MYTTASFQSACETFRAMKRTLLLKNRVERDNNETCHISLFKRMTGSTTTNVYAMIKANGRVTGVATGIVYILVQLAIFHAETYLFYKIYKQRLKIVLHEVDTYFLPNVNLYWNCRFGKFILVLIKQLWSDPSGLKRQFWNIWWQMTEKWKCFIYYIKIKG